jgi:hypothetical protein
MADGASPAVWEMNSGGFWLLFRCALEAPEASAEEHAACCANCSADSCTGRSTEYCGSTIPARV